MTMPLFVARHLHKRFGDQVVLEDISLSVEQGEVRGIMGPNGAGKTTCFNVLTGRYRPDRGQVHFDGVEITGHSPREIARRGISRSFQLMNLFDEYSVIDNIVMALPEIRSMQWSVLRDLARQSTAYDEAAEVLQRVGLGGKEQVMARSLSYGERRALEIGVALAARPKVLFLDEPTAGLGTEGTARLTDLVASLKRQLTIIVIEHDMRFIFGLADKVSVIHWGQVIAEGSPSQLQDNPWVRRSALAGVAT